MGDLERYIVEEWAEDYRDGRLNRREFLRRVALMAGGTAVALPVLRQLGVGATLEEISAATVQAPVVVAQAAGVTVPPDDPSLEGGMVAFPMGAVTVSAYLARPKFRGPAPGIVVIHENRGLLEHFKDVCRRLAKLGYVALTVDLASAEGGTAKYSDLAQVTAILGRTPPEQLVAMLNAGVAYLQGLPSVRKDRIGAVGFCFGGGMTWRLATSNSSIRAAVPFYGSNPPLEDVPKIRAAVLAVYGELDTRIDAGIPAIREAMQRAGITHEIVVYPGANHAFFNDTGDRYHETSAHDAWRRTVAWFERYLKQ
ncbi:MAG: dienelactone hydrolase family protein [Bacillati bacterium ANGP1]|uniref:Dienelactone hydrolase family protein n=1 Tax=Candidatus Segetimicrobium genomatis TaxID=2569760 RepID=A0A537IZT5_9BACT|nr:MAG: dienelactone hydrolase family protein [Terrabacteria group bacterium ANGP1]